MDTRSLPPECERSLRRLEGQTEEPEPASIEVNRWDINYCTKIKKINKLLQENRYRKIVLKILNPI